MATANNSLRSRMSREDYEKAKELEEMRKSGTAMPATDEEGRLINPHIPQYISSTPWYYGETGPTLKHQSTKAFTDRTAAAQAGTGGFTAARSVVRSTSAVGSRFRKGACENCGAADHVTKACLERPRARNARLLDRTLAADTAIVAPKLDWEGRRDTWQNADASKIQAEVMARHEKAEAERKRAREAALSEKLARREARKQAKAAAAAAAAAEGGDAAAVAAAAAAAAGGEASGSDLGSDLDDSDEPGAASDDDDEFADGGAVQQNRDSRSRATVRNLRLREDTAKYLRNLDLQSAFYAPKTRSMRENPYAADDPRSLLYAGDNALRGGGDAAAVMELQRFALQRAAAAGGAGAASGDALSATLVTPTAIESEYRAHMLKKEEDKRRHEALIKAQYGDSAAAGAGAAAAAAVAAAGADGGSVDALSRYVAAGGGDGSGVVVRTARNRNLLYGHYDGEAELASVAAPAAAVPIATTGARRPASGAGARATRYLAPGDANPALVPVTKYVEDEWLGKHTSVFGSWYDRSVGKWGFKCCHQTSRAAYCVPLSAAAKKAPTDTATPAAAAAGSALESTVQLSVAAPATASTIKAEPVDATTVVAAAVGDIPARARRPRETGGDDEAEGAAQRQLLQPGQ